MDSTQHIDNVLAKLRSIFEKTAERIDALKPGEKVPATELAKDIAKAEGMTGPQLYPTLKFLFDNYPGVVVKKGAHGGIEKITTAKPIATTTNTVDEVEDSE